MKKETQSAEITMLEECIETYNMLIFKFEKESKKNDLTIIKLKSAKAGIEYALEYIKDNLKL